MDPLLAELKALWAYAVQAAGADWKVYILAGGVLVMWLVVGKLVAAHIFKSDRGHAAVFLGCLAPAAAGLVAWAAVEAYASPPAMAVGGYPVTGAHLAGGAAGLLALVFLGKPFLGINKLGGRFLFLVLVYAASIGGYLLAQASLTVFESGRSQVEQRQGGLPGTD